MYMYVSLLYTYVHKGQGKDELHLLLFLPAFSCSWITCHYIPSSSSSSSLEGRRKEEEGGTETQTVGKEGRKGRKGRHGS